jgi:hypothetical protein
LEPVKFLKSVAFEYRIKVKKPPILAGANVGALAKSLLDVKRTRQSNENSDDIEGKSNEDGVVMFCGGVVSAVAICPRRDNQGKDTFNNI